MPILVIFIIHISAFPTVTQADSPKTVTNGLGVVDLILNHWTLYFTFLIIPLIPYTYAK